jgi:hypothetical protein
VPLLSVVVARCRLAGCQPYRPLQAMPRSGTQRCATFLPNLGRRKHCLRGRWEGRPPAETRTRCATCVGMSSVTRPLPSSPASWRRTRGVTPMSRATCAIGSPASTRATAADRDRADLLAAVGCDTLTELFTESQLDDESNPPQTTLYNLAHAVWDRYRSTDWRGCENIDEELGPSSNTRAVAATSALPAPSQQSTTNTNARPRRLHPGS